MKIPKLLPKGDEIIQFTRTGKNHGHGEVFRDDDTQLSTVVMLFPLLLLCKCVIFILLTSCSKIQLLGVIFFCVSVAHRSITPAHLHWRRGSIPEMEQHGLPVRGSAVGSWYECGRRLTERGRQIRHWSFGGVHPVWFDWFDPTLPSVSRPLWRYH